MFILKYYQFLFNYKIGVLNVRRCKTYFKIYQIGLVDLS